jgi:cyclopropane fatty-acyl-phospholipid synthase-like methyltransferase
MIRSHFRKDKDAAILDVGCGHGAIIYFACQAGYRNVLGVDGSLEQVTLARQLGIDGVSQGDLFDALNASGDSSLDGVIAFDVIEHFTRDELIEFVDAVRRVLRPGGKWIIHTPNGESPFASRMRYWDLTHELAFTRTSIAQLLLSSGFREVHSYEDEPVCHGVKSGIRWILWKAIRSALRFYIAVETGDARDEAVFSQNFLTVAVK